MQGLIIIDIQNDYFSGGKMELSGASDAAKKAKAVLVQFREKKLPVFHIQHISIREGSTFFLPDTEGVKINDFVKPIGAEKVIQKNYPNSFRNTILLDELKLAKIDDLVICGMMTHMCVDATTRAAFDLGFNCTVLSDACATRDLIFQDKKIPADHVHAAFLAALSGVYAKVVATDEHLKNLISSNA